MESIGRRVRDARRRSLSERIEQCGCTAAEEEAAVLLPTRREGLLLTLFWGALIAGIFLCYGMTWRSICGAIFAAALLWLSFLDLRYGMLYDCITLPLALLGAFFSMAEFLAPFESSLLGGILGGGFFYALHIISRGGIGGGDVKFALALGLWLGWEGTAVALWVAFLLGGAVAAFLLLMGWRRRRDLIPFGPFMALGGYLGFLYGVQLWNFYEGLM